MRVSAKADYAVRGMIELAAGGAGDEAPAKGETLALAQDIPVRFLENILGELRSHGLVQSRRGSDGGYWLARAPAAITIAEIIRAVEGPLASVGGESPEQVAYAGHSVPLARVWLALRANVREVLEVTTLADLVADRLPPRVEALAATGEAAPEA